MAGHGKPKGSPAPKSAWKPGASGNPGGRPKIPAEVRELARQHTAKAIKTLGKLLDSDNENARCAAANALLDRAWGKAQQNINVTETPFDSLGLEDQRALRDALAALTSGEEGDASGPEPTHH